jgi:hypothetical protein
MYTRIQCPRGLGVVKAVRNETQWSWLGIFAKVYGNSRLVDLPSDLHEGNCIHSLMQKKNTQRPASCDPRYINCEPNVQDEQIERKFFPLFLTMVIPLLRADFIGKVT